MDIKDYLSLLSLLIGGGGILAFVTFFIFFGLNKRQKNAEVDKTEADAKKGDLDNDAQEIDNAEKAKNAVMSLTADLGEMAKRVQQISDEKLHLEDSYRKAIKETQKKCDERVKSAVANAVEEAVGKAIKRAKEDCKKEKEVLRQKYKLEKDRFDDELHKVEKDIKETQQKVKDFSN